MKNNLFACILLLFTMASCSDKLDLEIGNEESLAHTTSVSMRSAGDSKYDVLGYGYDITGDYLHPMSVKNPVLDIEKYYKDYPSRIVTGTPSFGHDKMFYGYDALDFSAKMTDDINHNCEVSFPIDDAVFGGSISKNIFFNSRYSYSTKYSFASLDIIRNRKYIRINDEVDRISKYISKDFLEDINRLTPERLIERYGTHVITDFTIGGRYRLIYRSVIESIDDSILKRDAVKAGFSFTLGKIGLKYNVENNNPEIGASLKTENHNKELFVMFYGGKGSNMRYDLEKGMPTGVDIKGWEDNIDLSNSSLTNISWKETFPLYFFIKDPTKKAMVKQTIDNYIKNKKIKPLRLKPLHRLFSYNGGDTFYVYTKEDVDKYVNSGVKVVYEGVDGYILADEEVGTKPIYRMYNTRETDTYYVFSQTDVIKALRQRPRDRCEGIDGYILVQPQSFTKPIYRMFGPKLGDTYYLFDTYSIDKFLRERPGDRCEGIDGYIYQHN